MSARKQRLTPETEQDLRRVIAILAQGLAEADAETDRRGLRSPGVIARRLSAAGRVHPVAVALVRCVAVGDAAGADHLLAGQRPASEWRELALILASAVDLERLIEPAERRAA